MAICQYKTADSLKYNLNSISVAGVYQIGLSCHQWCVRWRGKLMLLANLVAKCQLVKE